MEWTNAVSADPVLALSRKTPLVVQNGRGILINIHSSIYVSLPYYQLNYYSILYLKKPPRTRDTLQENEGKTRASHVVS